MSLEAGYAAGREELARQFPEVARQTDRRQYRLGLVACTWAPVRVARVCVPHLGKPPEVLDAHDSTTGSVGREQPAVHVFFRPEETDGRSGESDVVEPVARGNEEVNDEIILRRRVRS